MEGKTPLSLNGFMLLSSLNSRVLEFDHHCHYATEISLLNITIEEMDLILRSRYNVNGLYQPYIEYEKINDLPMIDFGIDIKSGLIELEGRDLIDRMHGFVFLLYFDAKPFIKIYRDEIYEIIAKREKFNEFCNQVLDISDNQMGISEIKKTLRPKCHGNDSMQDMILEKVREAKSINRVMLQSYLRNKK